MLKENAMPSESNQKMRVTARNGDILARDSFVVAFFGCRPFSEIAGAARKLVEQWLTLVPADALRWAIVGKSSTKFVKWTPQSRQRCFDLLDKDVTTKKDIYFRIVGPQTAGPDYMALVKGFVKPRKLVLADQTNLVQFLFPAEFLSQFGADRVADLVASMFMDLPCDSGYAAPALHFGINGEYDKAAAFIAPLALQHHGFDVPANASTAVSMGRKCRGARWLTALSTAMVEQIGGIEQLKKRIARGVQIREMPQGVLIRAGDTPEIGAVNKGEKTPLVGSVARAIEPITYFHDNSILPLFDDDEDRRDRWERRFWWDQD
jgi:hypothetical protein